MVKVPWYWILAIIAAIVGPFNTALAYSKMLKRKKKMRQKAAEEAGKQDDPGHLS